MKKRILTAVLSVAMIASLAACGDTNPPAGGDDVTTTPAAPVDGGNDVAPVTPPAEGVTVLNVYSFTDEVPNMFNKYFEIYPDRDALYDVKSTIIATTDGLYEPALDQALAGGAGSAPDLYTAESAFVLKYTKYDAAGYAATYKDLGIDVDNLITAGDIATYSVDIGSNLNGEVVGLGYQSAGGCAIYRASIAAEVFGTDDPAQVANIIGPGFDKFFEAAEKLKAAGYKIVSGDGDVWHLVENSSDAPWVVDGKLNIDANREAFLDTSKKLYENEYTNRTEDWQEGWFTDMRGEGATPAFMFFGPAWLINYSMADQLTVGQSPYGDWRVTTATEPFFWGGTYLLASKDSQNKEAIGDFIEWVTLDTSDTGLQYFWANGSMNDAGTKDAVSSGTVMANANGEVAILGGQNMFDYFVPAGSAATGKALSQYDQTINSEFRAQVRLYAAGEKTKEQALADFKTFVADNLDVAVD
jgi:hypothetical protein